MEGSGNLSERKYFIKESEFNVNRWHSHYRVMGGSVGIAWAGDSPSCHWETHTSCWTQAEMKMPLCFSLLGAKGQAVPCLSVFCQGVSERFGERWPCV